jgi:hypothetical protein
MLNGRQDGKRQSLAGCLSILCAMALRGSEARDRGVPPHSIVISGWFVFIMRTQDPSARHRR